LTTLGVAESADVDPTASIGAGSTIWDLAQVREHAAIGQDCVLGRGSYVGAGVRIGDRVKIQNLALVYEPAIVEDGAFIGPAVVLTNDRQPRAVNPDGSVKAASDWKVVGVHVLGGASIGAGAVCVAPLTVGRWSMVAAGSTVTSDVPDYALVAGTPAKRIGWVGRSGVRLQKINAERWRCPQTGETYILSAGSLLSEARQDSA
jgi:acetyltransferase-like isoleucine patch superfamily enzyme